MNNFKTSLTHYMDAGFPILFIDSFEDKKIFHVVRDVFSSRDFLEWNIRGIFDYNSNSISLQLSLSDSLELFLNDVDNAKNKVSINKNYLSHIESGSANKVLSLPLLIRISKALDVELALLVDLSDLDNSKNEVREQITELRTMFEEMKQFNAELNDMMIQLNDTNYNISDDYK